jgi:hypothetical protein
MRTLFNELSQLSRRIPSNNRIRWHVHHHDSASCHDAALADRDARHDNGSLADPNIVFDCDWFNLFARDGRTGQSRNGICRMAGRIKNPHILGNLAVLPDRDLLTYRETAIVPDSGVIADDQCGMRVEACSKEKTALPVDHNVVSDNQFSSALNPMKVDARVQVSTVTRTVCLEERLAEKHSDNEIVSRPEGEQHSEKRNYHYARSGYAKIPYPVPASAD